MNNKQKLKRKSKKIETETNVSLLSCFQYQTDMFCLLEFEVKVLVRFHGNFAKYRSKIERRFVNLSNP